MLSVKTIFSIEQLFDVMNIFDPNKNKSIRKKVKQMNAQIKINLYFLKIYFIIE
jgi:hypothetical protein